MADLFPTDLILQAGTELPDTFYTFRSNRQESGVLKAQARWQTPKMRGGKLKFLLNGTDLGTLRDAWATARGSGAPVDFRYPFPATWYGLLVGVGDGLEDSFDLPVHDNDSTTIYIDGVEQDPNDYVITSEGGSNDRDLVVFDTAPADGEIITCDTTGERQILVLLGDVFAAVERGPDTYTATLSIDEV